MTHRGRIVLASAGALFTLFVIALVAAVAVIQTDFGRERVRQVVMSFLTHSVHGSMYVGRISRGFWGGVTVDSFAIRDADDSLFVSTGPVSVQYDLRDLLDRRIALRNVHAEHPIVYIRQHEDGEWNFRRIFASKPSLGPKTNTRGLGDYIVIDSAIVRNGTFLLTLPWHPSQHLRGRTRDSTIHFELTRKDHDVRRTGEGFARTWRWTNANAIVSRARIADPDSAGMVFRVTNAEGVEEDPPFHFRDIRGVVRQLGDSIWVDVPHVTLPGSSAHGSGKIVWGSDLPVRYAIHVIGDTVSMKDVAWIYPTLPTTGGGRTLLDIVSEPKNPHLIDYVLTSMDVHSTRSRLLGRMTFVLGDDTLGVKNVQLTAAPVNFDLLRTLNGKPFPYDWQGDITGTVNASGGNVARFKVEQAKLAFADAHVPGAITKGTATGEVNIYAPAFTAFHDLLVNIETLDLRTPQYLNKEFPRLHGTVSGHAVLDSSWLDVRFRDAEIFHHDGTAPVSRVTGSGRVTWGEKYLTYDLSLLADSLSFTAIQLSYPFLPFRGSFAGPVTVLGQSPDLTVNASLSGPAGVMTYSGHVDMDEPEYAANGAGTLAGLDLRRLFDNARIPGTTFNGVYTVNVVGDSITTLRGTATLHSAASTVGTVQLDPSVALLRFDRGMLTVDSAFVHTADGTLSAHGTVGLTPDRTGTLDYDLTLNSFGVIDRLLGRTPTGTISGMGHMTGQMTGSLDTVNITGQLLAHNLVYGANHVERATGSMALRDVTRTPSGTVNVSLDTIVTRFMPFTRMAVAVRMSDATHGQFNADLLGAEQIGGATSGRVMLGDSSVTVQFDSARVTLDSLNSYHLMAPTTVVADASAVEADSVLLARTGGGAVALRHIRVAGDSIRASLRTSSLDLGILQLFGSRVTRMHGQLDANVDVDGTTHAPKLSGSVTLKNGSVSVPSIGGQFSNIVADIGFTGDTMLVRRLSIETNKERRGSLSVDGSVVLGPDQPIFALRAQAKDFRAIDQRGLASLDISTSRPITLTGRYDSATVRGGVLVNRGSVYIPELIQKRVVDLNDPELFDVIDTTLAQNRALLPEPPTEFARHLRLENVAVDIGDDVWLRSDEANIKLGGSLNVTMGGVSGAGAPNASQLALEGTLRTVRGTYRLNIVPLVQPVFDVESGTLRFFGTPGLDPALNITAINTVRKPSNSVNGQDVRIRATIGGTLSAPTLTLSSADNLPLTQSDLLSYLITGEPAFALDYNSQTYMDQLAAVAIRSAGNVISSAIPRSVFDVVELQTAGARDPNSAAAREENPTLYNLLNTRAVLGKQLNNNLFLNFSTGFCAENFKNNLGFRLEYRIGQTYRVLFGLEPGSSELTCSRTPGAQIIQQTPPQFGFDFFRSWRF